MVSGINLLGATMVAAEICIGFLVGWLTSLFTNDWQLPYALASCVGLPIAPLSDLAYRWRFNVESGWRRFLLPATGGTWFLMPVWVFWGGVPIVGLLVLIVRKWVG